MLKTFNSQKFIYWRLCFRVASRSCYGMTLVLPLESCGSLELVGRFSTWAWQSHKGRGEARHVPLRLTGGHCIRRFQWSLHHQFAYFLFHIDLIFVLYKHNNRKISHLVFLLLNVPITRHQLGIPGKRAQALQGNLLRGCPGIVLPQLAHRPPALTETPPGIYEISVTHWKTHPIQEIYFHLEILCLF